MTLASGYALDDLNDGFTTLTDKINDFAADKNLAFDQQHALVENYFTRGLAEEKNIDEIFDAMNVHYISGINLSVDSGAGTATTVDNGADMSVYEDAFDHFTYDIAHLAQYSPGAYDYGTNYASSPGSNYPRG